MVVLITGASHTGKTLLAQKILEEYKIPYLSIDHLKMGLIRSGYTQLTPMEDEALTNYLWPILREIIKTAIENGQNLTIEGCYIPFDWKKDFEEKYLAQIKYYCLVMSNSYIKENFSEIKKYAGVIENRVGDDSCTMDTVLQENAYYLEQAQKYGLEYLLIDEAYQIQIQL